MEMSDREVVSAGELEQILAIAKSGSERAREQLFESFRRYLWVIANRRLGSDLRRKIGASDIVQRTMVKANRDFERFKGDRLPQLVAWLQTILTNDIGHVIEEFREAENKDIEKERQIADFDISGNELTPSLLASMNEEKAMILAAFEKLPDRAREFLKARFKDGESLEDMAFALKMSEDAVRKVISRALKEWVSLARREGATFEIEATDLHALLLPEPPSDYVPEKLGPYRIERDLGSGAFGVVFLATDVRTSRLVALKCLRTSVSSFPHIRDRFLREGRVLSTLDHVNLVKILEVGEFEEVLYIACEQCEGQSLREWQSSHGLLVPLSLAATIVIQIAAAVAHCHSRGVIHRDIKPANILLTPIADSASRTPADDFGFQFVPKLADFGLAKFLMEESGITASGDLLGTPFYMSPEQAGVIKQELGPGTDIYSLGILLFELLTHISPAQATSLIRRDTANVFENLPSVRTIRPDLPVEVEEILAKCLALYPEDRYASAEELAGALSGFSDRASA
jgi:RNA polymerase sigma-70 factor (subfamily 1)